MTQLHISINTLKKFEQAYRSFCDQAQAIRNDPQELINAKHLNFDEAMSYCAAHDAELIEIRTPEDAQLVAQHMKNNLGIYAVYAGLQMVNGFLKYFSTNTPNEWQYIKMCPKCQITKHYSIYNYTNLQNTQGETVHFVYKLEEGIINIQATAHKFDKTCPISNIICKIKKNKDDEVLRKLALHSCMRDREEIKKTNEMLETELAQISKPKRYKRALALIGAGLMGLDALSGSVTGESPLSHLGKGIAYTLGIATHKDLQLTKQELSKHAKELSNLSINQRLLIEAYTSLNSDIERLNKREKATQHDIAIMYAELDNKINIYRLQNLVQHSLIKMASAIQAGKQYYTSSYIFGQEDLMNMTTYYRLNNIPLTTSLADVITSVALIENTYTFIIAVPIINKQNAFDLYEVRSLPLFRDQKGYKVQITNNFIAVNTATNEYTTLTKTEYEACTAYSVCPVSGPFLKINTNAPCEVRTLKYLSNVCPLLEDPTAQPTFFTYGNDTYYSVPKPVDIHLSCPVTRKTFTETQTINDFGHFSIPEGCQANINNEISIRPGFVAGQHFLTDNTLFKILEIPSELLDIPTPPPVVNQTSKPPLSFRTVGTVSETLSLLFEHETATGEAIRIVIYISIVITILLLCYCLIKPFRYWINGCCFFQKPTVYWKKIKGYQVPDFKRNNKDPENPETESLKFASTLLKQQGSYTPAEQVDNQQQFNTLIRRVASFSENFKRTINERKKKSDELENVEVRPPTNFRSPQFVENN